ncbi:MAG TPA: hypothetical protein DCQ28_06720 [Bacteroidetes bacterium]|nr:hypothetical protein [Bacteroidota bacterium]
MAISFDLESEILKEHSKRQTVKIVSWINGDETRFAQLMQQFLCGEPRIVQRSSWIVSLCIENHPSLIKPWLSKIVKRAGEKNIHNAVKRNVVRALQFVDIPRSQQGRAANLCFYFLQNVGEPVAVKAFSMTVLANIAVQEPDLKQEIKLVIEQMLPYGSAGIQSRGRKVLKQLS